MLINCLRYVVFLSSSLSISFCRLHFRPSRYLFLSNLSANKFLFYFNFWIGADHCCRSILVCFRCLCRSYQIEMIRLNMCLKAELFLGVHTRILNDHFSTFKSYVNNITELNWSWRKYIDSLEIHDIKSDNIYINHLQVFFSNEMRHRFFFVSDNRPI